MLLYRLAPPRRPFGRSTPLSSPFPSLQNELFTLGKRSSFVEGKTTKDASPPPQQVSNVAEENIAPPAGDRFGVLEGGGFFPVAAASSRRPWGGGGL